MATLITIHGELRWLVALVAVIAIVKFAIGLIQKQSFKPMDRGLMAAYTGLMDLNLLLGLIIIIFAGGFTGPRIEHAGTMFIAIAIVHATARWRKAGNDNIKFRNNLIIVVLSILLIITGVIQLRGGWIFG